MNKIHLFLVLVIILSYIGYADSGRYLNKRRDKLSNGIRRIPTRHGYLYNPNFARKNNKKNHKDNDQSESKTKTKKLGEKLGIQVGKKSGIEDIPRSPKDRLRFLQKRAQLKEKFGVLKKLNIQARLQRGLDGIRLPLSGLFGKFNDIASGLVGRLFKLGGNLLMYIISGIISVITTGGSIAMVIKKFLCKRKQNNHQHSKNQGQPDTSRTGGSNAIRMFI